MLDVEAIRANGWRQGGFFREADHRRLAEIISREVPPETRILVVSQDCDMVHTSLEAEPFIEIIFAHLKGDAADGSFTHGKNPRRLQFQIESPNSQQYYECFASERYSVDRRVLLEYAADSQSNLSDNALHIITSWLAARYVRTAFPDQFNHRISRALRNQGRTLRQRGDRLSGLYIAITPWDELAAGDIYRVELFGTVELDVWNDETARSAMEAVLGEIAAAINSCDGVEVENYELRSEDDITLADIRLLRRWDYDYLTYRDEDGSATAVRI